MSPRIWDFYVSRAAVNNRSYLSVNEYKRIRFCDDHQYMQIGCNCSTAHFEMKYFVALAVVVAVAAAVPLELAEDEDGQQYYLVPLSRERR